MKYLFLSFSSLLFFFCSSAQNTIETEIRILEEKHVQAILQKDSAALRKIWPQDFMVNSPRNTVAKGGQIERVMSGSLAYTTYKFEMEQILIREGVVITMGNETVVPVMGNPKGGQTIKRRYTHFWQKVNGNWLLMARHANEICAQ
jgi:ketosteroid isomerase-like protein